MLYRVMFTLAMLPVWGLGLAVLPWAALVWFVSRDKTHALNVLIAIDQLGNALAFGDPDETISSRSGKCARRGGNRSCYWICRFLNLLHENHCDKTIENDRGRRV